MPDNDLAAALEFVKRRSAFVPTADNSTVVSKDELAALRTIRDAYLAREADDAKPVTSDWLVSVLGREPVVIDGAALWLKRPSHCSTRITLTIDGFVGYLHGTQGDHGVVLDTRKKLRAFLELADWPTNENGGE